MRRGKVELLAPAGSYEALVAAVQAGADAVYVGGLQFGARAFAHNFDNETMQRAVAYCHLRNVALYVTVNTLYDDEQFEDLIEYLSFLYEIGVDAFIIQDMGLFHIVKHHFPEIEIHMSTQASIRNIEGVRYFEDQNVDRVVLAREMNIQEIAEIGHQCDIDIEVFVHGALCMSYSGQCLMSSMIAKRSGNKGKCGQPCRLPYDLLEDGKTISKDDKYLLSPQDLCTIDHIDELIEAGIKSFKIEGRMKRPEYVYTVVSSYRKAIDQYLQQKCAAHFNKDEMKMMFNRGFTEGFLFHDSIALAKSIPGHQGIFLGKIASYQKKNHLLYIKLRDQLFQNDRIYFPKDDLTRTITKLYKNGQLVHCGEKGDQIAIELDSKINLQQDVYKVLDIRLMNQIDKALKKENVHIPLSMKLTGKTGKPLILTVTDGKNEVSVSGDMKVERALNVPLTRQRIVQQLGKLGNTVYQMGHVDISFPDDGMIAIKAINDLRRKAITLLDSKRICCQRTKLTSYHTVFDMRKRTDPKLAIKITDMKQLEYVDLERISQVFIPFYHYQEYHEKLIPYVPFLYDENDLIKFKESRVYQYIDMIMVSDFGAYHMFCNEKKIILNHNFNITNSYAVKELKEDCVLSLEMSRKGINSLAGNQNFYFLAYTKNINMYMKHCVISDHYFGYKNKNCSLCRKHRYQLKDRMNKKFDIMTDRYCHNYLLNHRAIYIDRLDHLNCDLILLEFFDENATMVSKIIMDFQNNILLNKKSEFIHNLDTFRGYY